MNTYGPGQSIGDSYFNCNSTQTSQLVASSDCKLFILRDIDQVKILGDDMTERKHSVVNAFASNFQAFNVWDNTKLRPFLHDAKERFLYRGECLVREGTLTNYVYFVLQGKLRVEKEVTVKSGNKWPVDFQKWRE